VGASRLRSAVASWNVYISRRAGCQYHRDTATISIVANELSWSSQFNGRTIQYADASALASYHNYVVFTFTVKCHNWKFMGQRAQTHNKPQVERHIGTMYGNDDW
jgi:hypothetical protein